MKSFKVLSLDKRFGRAIVEITFEDDHKENHDLNVTFNLVTESGQHEDGTPWEKTREATAAEITDQIKSEIARYEADWASYKDPNELNDDLQSLIGKENA